MQDSAPTRLVRLVEGEDVRAEEGEGIVAAAKRPGEPVIPARTDSVSERCLHRRLEQVLGRRLFVVHRIDRDASGIVLFATEADAHRRLSIAFEQRRVAKGYQAFASGTLSPAHGRLEAPLHAARKGKTRPARSGEKAQAAVTDYSTRKVWRAGDERTVSLVEARPLTGRHHQIRVHLRFAGAPILFDPLYARGRTPARLAAAPCSRLALHAQRIEVPSAAGGRLVFEAPLAPDLLSLREWLDRELS